MINTEISDFAAVRIHSKTTSIFSSVPIISRKRCAAGERSSALAGTRRWRKASTSARAVSDIGIWNEKQSSPPRSVCSATPKLDELAHAVLDVEAHAAERLHEGIEGVRLRLVGRQEAEKTGAQRRLNQRLEALLELLGRFDAGLGVRAHGCASPGSGRRSR